MFVILPMCISGLFLNSLNLSIAFIYLDWIWMINLISIGTMCSNTGSTSACRCGGSGGTGVSMWSSGLKKQQQQQQKRARVPKRGPGVAELEKILREQETIDLTTTERGGNVEGFSPSTCFINHHYPSSSLNLKSHHPPPSLPPSHGGASSNLSSHATSASKFDHLVPTTTPTMTLGRNGSGSGLVALEQELFPMNLNLNSCKSKSNLNEGIDGNQSDSGNSPSRNVSSESNPAWSYPTTIQKRNNQYPPPPPMMNSSGPLSIGLHTHQEPPSNQSSYYNYTSRAPEEHKMVGMKRVHTSSLDNSLIPPSNFQVLPSFSRYNRPHQSSTNESHGVCGYNSTNECYRDAKWGSTLELSSRRFNSDTGGPGHANFPPFATPEVPSPPMHLFQGVLSKGNVLPCQVTEDKMEDSCHRSESSGTERRPFYNFLKVNDQEGVTDASLGSNHGGREAGRGGIDLSLKL